MAVPNRQRLSNHGMITFNEDNIQRQYFAFPYPEMCYIRKNADIETQLKLRQTCKFFYKWDRMVIVENLFFGRAPSPNAGKLDRYVQNFDEMPMIDVVTNKIFCFAYDKRLITKIHRCEAKEIFLYPEWRISMEEFLFFTESGMVKEWGSSYANIRDEYGKVISLEALLFRIPYAQYVNAGVQDITRNVSSKILSWSNRIKNLHLNFSGPFNADQFYELLKKILAPKAFLGIQFIGLRDETYVATFKADMETKIKTWTPQTEKPRLFIYRL